MQRSLKPEVLSLFLQIGTLRWFPQRSLAAVATARLRMAHVAHCREISVQICLLCLPSISFAALQRVKGLIKFRFCVFANLVEVVVSGIKIPLELKCTLKYKSLSFSSVDSSLSYGHCFCVQSFVWIGPQQKTLYPAASWRQEDIVWHCKAQIHFQVVLIHTTGTLNAQFWQGGCHNGHLLQIAWSRRGNARCLL